jgi:hypothetical protein
MRMFLAVLLLALSGLSQAAIRTQEIPYQTADGTKMIGYYAYNDAIKGPVWATAHWPSICMVTARTPNIRRTPWLSCKPF